MGAEVRAVLNVYKRDKMEGNGMKLNPKQPIHATATTTATAPSALENTPKHAKTRQTKRNAKTPIPDPKRQNGVQVVLTRSDVCKGHPEYYQDLAAKLAADAAAASGEPVLYIDQFNNPANPRAHREGTGPEIWAQVRG